MKIETEKQRIYPLARQEAGVSQHKAQRALQTARKDYRSCEDSSRSDGG